MCFARFAVEALPKHVSLQGILSLVDYLFVALIILPALHVCNWLNFSKLVIEPIPGHGFTQAYLPFIINYLT
jgi:hypothetical protein